MKLKDRVAIITGGGRGLGRAIALAMSREGAHTVIMSRSESELKEVAEKITNEGGECTSFVGDVSKEDHVSRLVNEIVNRFSKVDILVNNAAIIGPVKFLSDTNYATWVKTMNINLNGVFLCSRFVVPKMSDQGNGKIINISSGLGQMPFPRFCAYSVSKAGVIQLTRSLSEELKESNIQVNAIDPGVMDTNMQDEIRKMDESIVGKHLHHNFWEYKEMGVLRDPLEIAPLAVFLASPESNHLSGHIGSLDYYTSLGWRSPEI